MMALTLSVPIDDWLTPWLYTVTTVEAFGTRCRQRLVKACGMRDDIIVVDCLVVREPGEQTGKQSAVAVGADRQMKIGDVDCHRPARIDEYDAHFRPLLPRRSDSLIKHGVAPGEIGPDQHDEVCKFEVLICSRHDVRAEGPPMARN